MTNPDKVHIVQLYVYSSNKIFALCFFFFSFQRLLTDAGPESTVFLTSGYFNLTRAYMRLVLGAGASYRILTASPEVNGFFGAKGVAGAIPAAYIHIARQFYNQVCRLGQQERVHLHEYHRSQWTFHAKGEIKPHFSLFMDFSQRSVFLCRSEEVFPYFPYIIF